MDAVCQAWTAAVTSRRTRCRCSSGVRSGTLLFAVYSSPVADVIASHGVQHHQFADDTQLRLAMAADNTARGLSILAACTGGRQTVVHAELTAAQPGQVGGTHHWNHRSAKRCHLCCVFGSCCRCRTTSGRRNEASGYCSRLASDI